MEPITFQCTKGNHSCTMTASTAAAHLQALDDDFEKRRPGEGRPFYSFGDAVSDPFAVVKRLLHFMGWKDVPGHAYTMACPDHQGENDG